MVWYVAGDRMGENNVKPSKILGTWRTMQRLYILTKVQNSLWGGKCTPGFSARWALSRCWVSCLRSSAATRDVFGSVGGLAVAATPRPSPPLQCNPRAGAQQQLAPHHTVPQPSGGGAAGSSTQCNAPTHTTYTHREGGGGRERRVHAQCSTAQRTPYMAGPGGSGAHTS